MSSPSSATTGETVARVPAAPLAVDISGVSHHYRDGRTTVAALGPIDLRIEPGEFVVIVGASGCGKSTLLRLLAGFERPSEGSVLVDGVLPQPGRQSGIVFQEPRLLPWRTVGGNIDLALQYAGLPSSERAPRRDQLLQRVGLPDVSARRTWQLSGGQQQRVAIARALAVPTQLLLLDEPFAALDALTREQLQEDLRAVSARDGGTSVFVTHSVDEAVFLGSRIVVLTQRPGRIAIDLPVPLPREGIAAQDLRGLPEYAALRSRVSHELRAVAA